MREHGPAAARSGKLPEGSLQPPRGRGNSPEAPLPRGQSEVPLPLRHAPMPSGAGAGVKCCNASSSDLTSHLLRGRMPQKCPAGYPLLGRPKDPLSLALPGLPATYEPNETPSASRIILSWNGGHKRKRKAMHSAPRARSAQDPELHGGLREWQSVPSMERDKSDRTSVRERSLTIPPLSS